MSRLLLQTLALGLIAGPFYWAVVPGHDLWWCVVAMGAAPSLTDFIKSGLDNTLGRLVDESSRSI